MWNIVLYIFIGMVFAFFFKLIVGLVSGGIAFLFMSLLGFKDRKIDLLIIKHPKLFFGYGVLLNTTIGVVYSIFIALITLYFIINGGNRWVLMGLSIIWGFSLLRGAEAYHGVLLTSCLGGLIAFYIGLGIFGSALVWFIVATISLAYYFGRIDVVRQQMIESGEIELLNELENSPNED